MKRLYKVLAICLILLGLGCPGCKPSSTAQLEENKALVRRVIEEMGKQNWPAFMELHAPDLVYHTPGSRKAMTRDELVQSLGMMYAAFPDFSPTIEDIIAEGDKVVIRETWRGTHKGEIQRMKIPPTGKEVTVSVIIIFRIAGGKIAEAWDEYDRMTVMQQLGVMPSDE